ncbi:hypothetical protein FACS1894139_02900 [Planctomycetales bacterium]|nr:hypothetical protein FACS1894107_11390 [Planctomycetales bacterium]GHT03192.1 hypothetical protein FACS1894139_02900 [Planctomycetales bacterium]
MPTFADLRPLTADLPPLVLLSSLDFGGAGIAARRLLEGLLAAGADARMICLQKKSNLPQVGELKHPQTGQPLWNYDAQLRGEVLRNYPHRPAGAEMFSLTRSLINLADFDFVKNAPLVHLHWVAGLVGFPQAREVFAGKKLVWTLHDMNPFTGGCHYSAGCEKWKTEGCQNCPQLGTPAPTVDYDLAAANFVNKYDGYQGLNLTIATPSQWLGADAKSSLLLRSFPQQTIPYGFSLEDFSPQQPDNARYMLGLPDDRKIILFGADDANNHRKGLRFLIEALGHLKNYGGERAPLLAVFGMPPRGLPPEYECKVLGRLETPQQLATAYSAADVFVLPSLEDNLPNTLIEAQACGAPGIGFAIGGIPDIIQDGATGYLAAPQNAADLAEKIHALLNLPAADYERMRENCRAHALANYAPELQVERYLQLYRRLLKLPEKSAASFKINEQFRMPITASGAGDAMTDATINNIRAHLSDDEAQYIFAERVAFMQDDDNTHINNIVRKTIECRLNEGERLPILRDTKKLIVWVLSNNLDFVKINGCLAEMFGIAITHICTDFQSSGMRFYEQAIANGIKFITSAELNHQDAIIVPSGNYELQCQRAFHQLQHYGFKREQFYPFIGKASTNADYGFIGLQYFDLPEVKSETEGVFIDGGGFNGLSTLDFANFTKGKYRKIYCFEPIPQQYKTACNFIEQWGLHDVTIINKGLWSDETILSFSDNGDSSSANVDGTLKIPVTTIDSTVGREQVTFIKLDVGGAELEALKGAANTIRRDKPKLAICIYHKPNDVLTLPAYILSLVPEYRLFIRHYGYKNTETVLYAVMPEVLAPTLKKSELTPRAPAQPQISVIIPVYNTEKYLRRCLDSVLKQTLREIEIICVNDRSPDNSLTILREYAERDARIKVIDFPENKGVSVARNAGIDAALGEYLGFVDSDDTVDLNFYEQLYKKAKIGGAEMVKGNSREILTNGEMVPNRINELVKTHKMFFVCHWWSAIYKTSLIKNKQISFPPGLIAGQDCCFLIQAVSQANRVATVDDVYYNYMRQENSTTYALTAEKIFAIAESRKFIIDYLNSLTIDAEGYLITFNEQTHILVHYYERETDPKIRRRLVEYLQYFYSKCRYPQHARRYDLQLPATGANTGSAPKVSVIIPIYNVEPYLRQCLDSVVNQTLKEVEIIGIDDGSTDNSLAILREYAAKDERIKVVALPKNGGVSAARNVGLASATGEYLGFIDSDDYIDLNFYEALYRQAQTGGADIVKCRRKEIGLDGKVVIDELNLNARVAKNKIYFTHEWTTAIYRAALIRARQVECPVGVVFGEDTCFLLKAVYYANRVDLIDNVYYTYLRRDNSASKAGGGHKGKETAIKIPAFRYIVDFINSVPMDENEYRFRFNICAYQVSEGIRLGGGDSTEVARALTDLARELDSKNKYRQVSPLAKNLGAAVAGKPNGLSFIELSPLVENLPAVVTLAATDFIGATPNLATQIHFGLVKSGAKTQMVTLWKKTNIPTIGELQNNGKPLYHSVRGAGVNAHFDLRQIADLLNRAGLLHFFDIRGLVEFSLAAPLLRGKKIVWTLENILQLADADALTTIGEPPLNIVITTPTDELAAQVKQHPALKNFSVIAIPSGDDDRSRMTALTLYLQLYRHFWGLPEKIIMPEALMQKVSTPMQAGAIGDALALYDAHRRNLAINQPSAALAEFDELIAQMKELLAKQKLSATAMPSPAISVLVPVYKVEKYLRKCLDSILAQTFTDFELIVVDDASPDHCGKICDEYAAKDPRIKVIHKPQNEGLPQARKTGFAASRGAYIQFVDSDDWLEPDMLAKMFYAAVSGDCDLVYSDYWWYNPNSAGVIERIYTNLGPSIGENKIENIKECVLHRTKTAKWNCVVWNKLYRRSVVAAIKFPPRGNRAEDNYITCQALYYAGKIGYLPFAMYHYCYRPESVMNDPAQAVQNYYGIRDIFVQIEQFLRDKFSADFAAFALILKRKMADIEKQNPDYRPVNHVYDEGFYSRHLAGSLSSAKTVLPLVVNLVKPQSVCDVGCGTGAWLKTCAEIAGIADENAVGFDFDVPVSQLLIKQQQYRNTDLKIPVVCERKFDLCISVEVAEHIPHKQSEIFVQSLVDLAPVILFSAAVPGQGGTEHINEQWPLYWEQIFRKKNYYGIDLLRSQIWDNNRIDWWYRQNIVLFVREDKLAELGLEKPQSFLLPLVHPQSKQWRRAERQPVGIINPDTIPLHRDVFGPYKNCFQGKDCVVLGTGPTLNSYQPLKDAIHIGVNGAVLYDKVNLDYYFLVNYLSVEVFFKKVVASSAQKFIGQHIDYSRRKFAVPQEKCNQSNARIFGLRQYWGDSEMQLFESQGGELNPDLLNAPMTILDGSATMGIQFALWGHAKRIFIVGCDGRSQDPSTIYAYFDGHPNALHRMATYKISTSSMEKALSIAEFNMRKIKELRDKHYPDTEIISINPVQYKGLFDKDIYVTANSVAGND